MTRYFQAQNRVTNQPDHTDWVAESEISASPSGSIVHQATVTLTDAQIKALPTTAVEIIAEPGANKLLVPIVIMLHMKWVADYSNIDPTAQLKADTAGSFMALLSQPTLSGVSALLAGGGPDGTWVPITIQQLAKSVPTPAAPTNHMHNGVADSGFYDADIVNISLSISLDNAEAGDLEDGDPDNELQVSVVYYILNTVTGEFE